MATTTTKLEKVTPKKAREWLEKANGNRMINRHRVMQYQMDIEQDRWAVNGAAIVFDKDGKLLDGQHRLTAIVKSKKSITTVVVRGIESDGFATLDVGKTRGTGDFLYMHGGVPKYAATIAAGVLLLYHYEMGHFDEITKLRNWYAPPHMIYETFTKHPKIAKTGASIIGSDFRKWVGVCPPGIAIFCHYMFQKQDRVKADAFITQVREGIDLPAGSPVLWLRDYMRTLYNKARNSGKSFNRETRLLIVAWFFIAWAAYRDDQKLPLNPGSGRKKKMWRPGEKFPEI